MRILQFLIFLFMTFSASVALAESFQGTPSQDENFRSDVFIKLTAQRYIDLEHQYAGFLESYTKGKISEEELASKFTIFSNAHGLESRIDEWVKAYPKSYPAMLARGVLRISLAWSRRSGKFAEEVTEEQRQEFSAGLKLAAADLLASTKLYAKPVESYRQLIKVSMGLGLDADRGLLNEALKLDPQAFYPRVEYQYSLTPKWGGSIPKMEAFLKECQSSPLSAKNRAQIEVRHYTLLGEQDKFDKNYRKASDDYLKAYRHGNGEDPEPLYWSGQSAFDGSFYELALQRLDELIEAHPKYEYGYTKRGYLYESHFKNDKKAFNDYLSAAELGDSWAQNRIGWWYLTGKYVAQDYILAELYLRRAAAKNNKNAITNLAYLDKLRKSTDSAR